MPVIISNVEKSQWKAEVCGWPFCKTSCDSAVWETILEMVPCHCKLGILLHFQGNNDIVIMELVVEVSHAYADFYYSPVTL